MIKKNKVIKAIKKSKLVKNKKGKVSIETGLVEKGPWNSDQVAYKFGYYTEKGVANRIKKNVEVTTGEDYDPQNSHHSKKFEYLF